MFTAADKNTCRKNRRTIRNHIDRFCIINTHVILCSREYQSMYVCIRRYTFARDFCFVYKFIFTC